MMENKPPTLAHAGTNGQLSPNVNSGSGSEIQNRKRSGSGGGILSRFPFMRMTDSRSNPRDSRHVDIANDALNKPQRALTTIAAQQAQQKTRKRKGSLRKVALLGRGAQRERRDLKPLPIKADTVLQPASDSGDTFNGFVANSNLMRRSDSVDTTELGLGISDVTPRPSMDGYARRADMSTILQPSTFGESTDSLLNSPTKSYTSTTDDEDILSIKPQAPSPLRPGLSSLSSGSESYLPKPALSIQRRRSVKHAKSPLSLQGLTASPLPAPDADHDYAETEWWGWIILVVTWIVFATGMGSCLGLWSWAWDVGTTPYAPPEFEDDPTLPIVGYYPSLMILTCIMAWVWVITAWVGMKYFRHAKISGD